MSGDYSRVRFDPRTDIAGVLMQQGRVQLDSDWNELVAALDRRLRAETIDTFGVQPKPGFTGVAVVSPQTPDAFKVEASGGNITIGRGRMYVDGLLAENHGGGKTEFDPVLAESRGQTALAYDQQPYFPAPPPLPAGGSNLAYLEVWQREITYLQRPELVESALSVDTTTRLQTVWQVRFLTDIGDASCSTPEDQFSAWQSLIHPSDGRMSIRAEDLPPELDPCELPPSGGYRGLENQLYRIEIHDGGGSGGSAATFKWSRDNASVASNVVEIVSQTAESTELKLGSLGRDAVLRFSTGDWVEILDDRRELSGENGDPALRHGVIRKITVEEAKQTIRFSPALPADLIPAGGADTLAARHTRVQRWDQKGKVRDANNNIIVDLDAPGGTGLIPVPAAGVWVTLENGIQVQFSLEAAGKGFHCGDYWVSAARTADTSVEILTQAAPKGIHRHYARLAIIVFPNTESDDCRVHWPPVFGDGAGCCTITVAPGDSIQTALDSLPAAGGCVCLKTGVHNVVTPIVIRSSRIILHGEGPGAIVRSSSSTVVLQIGSRRPLRDIVVQSLRFEVMVSNDLVGIIVFAHNCARLRIEHCEMVMTASASYHLGIYLNNVSDVSITHNRLENLLYGLRLNEYADSIDIRGNVIEGIRDNSPVADTSMGQTGISVNNNKLISPCRIEDNLLRHFWVAVHLSGNTAGSVVSGNRISRSAGEFQETVPDNNDAVALREYLDNRLYAIVVDAAYCEITGNAIDLNSNLWGGIRISARYVSVGFNSLRSLFKSGLLLAPASIYCEANAKQGTAADHVSVSNNYLLGQQTGIVVSRINGVAVNNNHIDGEGRGWYGVRVDECNDTCVQDNKIQDVLVALHSTQGARNCIRGNQINDVGTGIAALKESDGEISGNRLQSCAVLGIALFARGAATLSDNRLMHCGYSAGPSLGLIVYSEELGAPSGALVRIEGCEVIDTGVSANGNQVTATRALSIFGWAPALQVVNNRVGYTQAEKLDPRQEHRAFLFTGPLSYRVTTGGSIVEQMFGSALLSGNHFRGPGFTTLVEFFRPIINDKRDFRFEKVTFSNNICDHLNAEFSELSATVRLWGGQLIVMGNHIKGPSKVNAMSLGNLKQVALMGNVTTGDYIQVGSVTPTPINNFNVRI